MYVCVCIFGLIHTSTSYIQPVLHTYTYKHAGSLMYPGCPMYVSMDGSRRERAREWWRARESSRARARASLLSESARMGEEEGGSWRAGELNRDSERRPKIERLGQALQVCIGGLWPCPPPPPTPLAPLGPSPSFPSCRPSCIPASLPAMGLHLRACLPKSLRPSVPGLNDDGSIPPP